MKRIVFLLALLAAISLQAVRITEFMASNKGTIKDSFGESSDWVELYNDGETFSLDGWSLTDNEKKPRKWEFPATNFVAGTYMLVWCSDREISAPGSEMHTGFKLSASGEYLGLFDPAGNVASEYAPTFPIQYEDVSYGDGCKVTTEEVILRSTNSFCRYLVPTNGDLDGIWYRSTFDDSAWSSGTSGVGYEKNPSSSTSVIPCMGINVESEMYDKNGTVYIRMPFTLEEKPNLQKLLLRMLYDDGFVVYLNGVEVARVNAPATVSWNSCSPTYHTESNILTFEDVDISTYINLLRKGQNVLCVHGLNDTTTSTDFLMEAELRAKGVDSMEFTERGYFSRPTPGAVNGEAYEEFLQPLVFNKDSGFYEDSFELTIKSPDEGVTIRYTTDATEPTASNGTVYRGSITIDETTVIRAGVFKEGAYSPRPAARTFVFLDDVINAPSGVRPGPKWPSGSINNQRFDYGMDTRITQSARYGGEMKAAFEQIPMLSIVTSPGNLFDSRTGIYVNAWQDGRNWERYAQLMYLTHDGSEGFNVGCGLRIRGGASRSSGNAKHSWRLFFRGEYGNSKLEYPLFGSEGALEFDKMDIRTAQNYSWSCEGGNDVRENIMCRDVFARDLQREMGEPYTRSRYVHILLNGHYWGLYQFQERAEEHFAETYFGGDKDDYDVIKPDGYVAVVNSGNIDGWKSLWQMASAGFTDETYQKAIGRNPDGTRNPRFPVLLDPTNLADYTIINNFMGNTDGPLTMTDSGPNNFFAIYDRVRQGGFKYFCHDTEHAMVKMYLNTDKTGNITTGRDGTGAFNPRYLHQRLCAVDAYKRVFQSRVNLHYFNGGLLTPDRANRVLLSRVHEIDKAIVCESARWGDVRTDARQYQPLNRDDHWWPEIHWITNTFFPTRNTKNLEQFRNRGWYPRISPPRIYPNGGKVVAGTKVTMSGETYVKYTLDGTDPFTSETAKRYTGPITIDKPTYVRCTYDPAYCDTPMDVSARFTLSEKSPLLVTELMYMPAPPEEGSPFEDKDYEFIELFNNSDKLFYPEGQSVTGGVEFVFAPGAKPIEPRSYVLLVKNPAAFAERYETNDLNIAGTFEGSLSNDGEHLTFSNYDLSYSGYWFEDARGFGPSIVAARYDLNYADYSTKLGWRLSGEPYGSPGREDLPEPSLVIISLLALWGVRKLSF